MLSPSAKFVDEFYACKSFQGKKLLCLVDGEHYPPVTKWALQELENKGNKIVAVVFLGGTEKVEDAEKELKDDQLDHKIYMGESNLESALELIEKAIDKHQPDVAVDLSDEPIISYEDRFTIGSLLLSKNIAYFGADFYFSPPEQMEILEKPSLSIIGTGKRVGKTAVSVFIAQTIKKEEMEPIIVAMGRGGPAEPEIIDHNKIELTPQTLIDLSQKGVHAASDCWEDALLANVTTIGCRRCGGGLAGDPFISSVKQGTQEANRLPQKLVIMEGSGQTIPPIKTNTRIVIISALQPIQNALQYFGQYRIKTSDLAIVTMCANPGVEKSTLDKLREGIIRINPDIKYAFTGFKPKPMGDIKNKNVFLATTAKEEVNEIFRKHLEKDHNCKIKGISNNLSNRAVLRKELAEGLKNCDVLLSEIKAASIDVAATYAYKNDVEVIFMNNEPFLINGNIKNLKNAITDLSKLSFKRFGE
ncbi:MAG: cyclic 2,3-diphosphoglycerate synthetase [Candidatus Cloacimonetes bacterium]|nr:cyclic 2,3-diphosphoglycerate synthetase [Candidatus Cloacimonadota bacterium]